MTTSPAKILVGVDGSPRSAAALQWAAALAARSGATVSALAAWSYPTALLMPVVGAAVPPADYLGDQTRVQLVEMIDALPAGSTVEARIVMGAPRIALTEATADQDMLVLGRTGQRGLSRLVVGSTASYCARHAECPVVIVRDSLAPEQTLTVAVDGSPTSMAALIWAVGLGPDHDIVAVYSHDEWELDELPLDDALRARLDVKAEEMLATTVRTALEGSGVDESRVKLEVRQGDPRSTIVDQDDADGLLVLGAQGYAGISRWALGSLADYAVNNAPGSVAIWRPRS